MFFFLGGGGFLGEVFFVEKSDKSTRIGQAWKHGKEHERTLKQTKMLIKAGALSISVSPLHSGCISITAPIVPS